MRKITVDFSLQTYPLFAGYVGEHNATELTAIKPNDLEGVTYSLAFMTNGEVIHSEFFGADEEIKVTLWQQLTQDNTLYVQLEAYDENGEYLGKSTMVKLVLSNSVHGTDVIADSDNPDVYSEIALNTWFRETLEDNADTLDKLTTSEDGTLLFDGKKIEGVGGSSSLDVEVKTDTEDEYVLEIITDTETITTPNLKGADGKSGVYVGSGDMPDGYNIQIDPEGDTDYLQITPLFANNIEECTDTSKVYVLPDGYIYAYMEKLVEGGTVANFTNQIPVSTDTDGSVYNNDGYAENMYLSNGVPASRSGIDCSGFIPIGCGSSSSASGEQVVRMSGVTAGNDAQFRIAFYDANKNYLNTMLYGNTLDTNTWNVPIPYETDASGNYAYIDFTAITAHWRDATSTGTVAYIRICCPNIDGNSVLTVNEEITYTAVEDVIINEWTNTGHAFIPADYEDRIIALEQSKPLKSRHEGKTCVCFGDSIVGNMASPNDYPTVLGKETGMTVINAGFGGCRMSASTDTVYNAYSMVKLADAIAIGDWSEQENGLSSVTISHYAPHIASLKKVDWSKIDFITIGYGTNDIANFVNVDNEENPLDTTTVLGGLRYALTTILTAYPNIKILILTPIYRYFNEEGLDSDEKEFYGQRTFTTWTDGILEVAKEFKVPGVDMYRTLGFNKLTRGYYYPDNDGTHPNALGLKVMAGKIAGKLLSEY